MRHLSDIPETMDTWLYGLARVQEKVDVLETVRMMLPVSSAHPLQNIRPIQFPLVSNSSAGSDYWLGVEYPATYEPSGDKISVSLFNYNQISPTSSGYAYNCGLVLDDWTEIIPMREINSGLTFNYDQPNAKPPQNVLLAINPQVMQSGDTGITKPWRLEDLLHTLLDTLDLARMRMVEPDHFRLSKTGDKNPYTKTAATPGAAQTEQFEVFKWLLPAVVGEITPRRVDANGDAITEYEGADSVQQVSFDYNPNNDAPPSIPGTSTSNNPTGIINWNAVAASQVFANSAVQQFLEEQSTLSDIATLQTQITSSNQQTN